MCVILLFGICFLKDTNKYIHNRLFVKPQMPISNMIDKYIVVHLYN